ncbi:argininosuccinate synthase [Candidatus Pantoea edessiphila]|uniref:Argininosuccinate synthase n=1 Tax=Candidatus Pantoea edessiphila TaxID=2044610 RepID=A0A2P5SZ46_9GAMM|nr:argininosuccinate synthase [Candidatus Pantoea edessiphila]MBK4775264.1 argininosuccinate synthase [Pantoea sp. Edef]PPI87596.1 argininosuccinate synthase [Candidatus Pantoea edessiphila]
MKSKNVQKIVLAYSGGLDTSAIIPWLKENYKSCEVIAFVADIGQPSKSLLNIEKKAKLSGASSCYIIDLKEEFVRNYIYPVLQTGATYEGFYLMGTCMARPIIAKAQVDLAIKTNADTLCHGATGKGNDQVRFETAYATLAPHLQVIAPWREWHLSSRESILQYLKDKNIPTDVSIRKIYSRDENAWHASTEGGILEDPSQLAEKDCWIWTSDPIDAPDQPEKLVINIEKGEVIAINNERLTPLQCLNKLNIIGAKHSIGRVDMIENRLIGIKSRGCYETPGGTIIFNALRALEQLVLDRESFKWRQQLGHEMSYVVYEGRWFTPLRKSIQYAAKVLTEELTGEITIQIYKGNAIAIEKKSINSLYSKDYSTFSKDNVYNHKDADGFIKLFSLSSRIRALKKQNKP